MALALLGAALVVVPSSAYAQEPIDGQYIVVLKDNASTTTVKKKARDRGGQIQRESFGRVLNGFAAELDGKALAAVKQDPAVAFVEQDQVISVGATQANATWGLDRLDQRDLPLSTTYTYGNTGQNVKAFIIDTGIRLTHGDFGGRATSGYDAVDGGSADDCNGHGTHVAGTVGGSTYGVAKNVSLVAVRVLDCNGDGTTSGVIAGVNWVTSNRGSGPAVANMSLGGGISNALDTAVRNSINAGVTYALAAGNENANACNSSPARTAEAITVGATTRTDARASFSNYGSCVDVFAPGSGITSAWHTSNTATSTISGTSMASPHVAGAAAVFLQGNPTASPAEVASALIGAATTGKVSSPGTGSPNRLLHVAASGGGTTPTPTPTPSPTPTPTPTPTPAPCGNQTATGSLARAGASVIVPNGTYYQSTVAGTHRACLTGPAGTDFDVSLLKWNGSGWTQVAVSDSPQSVEEIRYSGTPGYYYWRVSSYSGSGAFTLTWQRP
ncbi:S8 family peptidase [Solirubrobacter deserti]|uniref:S8 family peptidase n=1 Tax=Solirubrobacter deserti TaxID=2282478 RepID=A0ABT4RJJ5_9ACTN|nr:S8 family peptidase [Solirubrobacter deserti]MDA0138516.1 S8 family peptidase [Solirubrobacter deserti]